MDDRDAALRAFLDTGDTGRLQDFVRSSGRDVERYGAAVRGLEPVFERLRFGEQPDYGGLDRDALDAVRSEVGDVVRWMLQSDKADVKGAAIELMGALRWPEFSPLLRALAASPIEWERTLAAGIVRDAGDGTD